MNPSFVKVAKLECISEQVSDEEVVDVYDFCSSNNQEITKNESKPGDVISGLSLRESEFYFVKPGFMAAKFAGGAFGSP
jgi:hypothetical protein